MGTVSSVTGIGYREYCIRREALSGWHNESVSSGWMKRIFLFLHSDGLNTGGTAEIFAPTKEKSFVGALFFCRKKGICMKIKICGIRTAEAAVTARDAGADFLGFILWPKSRRYILPEAATSIVRKVQGTVTTVGVVVDQDLEETVLTVRKCGLDVVQLHGHETPEYAEKLRKAANVKIIKAYRWQDDFDAKIANDYPADYILLDTFKKGMAGGTGETFPWREAAEETGKLKKPLLLAGGISEENAREAASILAPFAVDVSGSLEENGEKSTEKIRSFMRTIERIRKEEAS